MQRISGLAACRELGSLAACSPGRCAWKSGPTCGVLHRRRWACTPPARPFAGSSGAKGPRLCSRRFEFAGQTHRPFSSRPGGDRQPEVSVVGIPDPITWIRCKMITYFIHLYFDLDLNSAEFERGAKQALVHVSDLMSSSRYNELVGIVSKETIDYVEMRCSSLSAARRQQLAVTMDEIIFMLPEDVSVVFDQYGRKFCFVVMRFWFLSTHEGPDDPEGTKIFNVNSGEDDGPPKKIVTAVYEFQRELTRGASPDWTVTTVWHWHWKPTE